MLQKFPRRMRRARRAFSPESGREILDCIVEIQVRTAAAQHLNQLVSKKLIRHTAIILRTVLVEGEWSTTFLRTLHIAFGVRVLPLTKSVTLQ